MADYYSVVSRAVAALEENTDQSRRTVYARARDALGKIAPTLNEQDFQHELLALEAAILQVENDQTANEVVPPTPLSSRVKTEDSPSIPRDFHQRTSAKKSSDQKILGLLSSTAFGAAIVVAFMVLAFGPPIYARGAVWLSHHALEYMIWPTIVAFGVCVVILTPLSFFRATRTASAFGFLISSYVFGASTCVAGVVATYSHLGMAWTIAGLLVFFVGVVPLGIAASIINSDSTAVWLLCAGLVLTFGARFIATRIVSKIEFTQVSPF